MYPSTDVVIPATTLAISNRLSLVHFNVLLGEAIVVRRVA
jgi:hypothetical protein